MPIADEYRILESENKITHCKDELKCERIEDNNTKSPMEIKLKKERTFSDLDSEDEMIREFTEHIDPTFRTSFFDKLDFYQSGYFKDRYYIYDTILYIHVRIIFDSIECTYNFVNENKGTDLIFPTIEDMIAAFKAGEIILD